MSFKRKKTFDQKIEEAPLPTKIRLKDRGKKRVLIKNMTRWQRFLKWARPNLRATAGAGMALGKNPMHSSKIKGMGSMLDDPSNFYLTMNAGGIVSLVL